MGDFLSWGRGLKVRASDPFPKQNTGTILATKERPARGFVGQTFQSAGWAAFQPPVHPRGNPHPNLSDCS
jgi:hypothetical protein